MDCHRCENLRYSGSRYGRCSHVGHQDVVISRGTGGARPYNREICPDFVLRRRCSNCRYWVRGKYFADGKTPATKGRCSLDILYTGVAPCAVWRQGPTSSRKKKERKEKRNEKVKDERG